MNSVVPAAEHELLVPGTAVGDYEIDDELGHGGMGVVYRAEHPVIGKRAAIKVLRREMAKNPDTVDRFVQEARSVNQIGHPNIVDIFAFGTLADGRPYLMMDLLIGESLRARRKRGPLHVSEAASVLDEVTSALAAAHAKGIIHRDLKPDNVFLVERQGRWPEVKLLDFGLAKLVSGVDTPVRTHTGIMLGTPDYMAPEQIRRRGVIDARVDVYALGVMAFESLTGRRPLPRSQGYDDLLAIIALARAGAVVDRAAPAARPPVPRRPHAAEGSGDAAVARRHPRGVQAASRRVAVDVGRVVGDPVAGTPGGQPLARWPDRIAGRCRAAVAVALGAHAGAGDTGDAPAARERGHGDGAGDDAADLAVRSDLVAGGSAAGVRSRRRCWRRRRRATRRRGAPGSRAVTDEEDDLLETTNPRDQGRQIREKAAAYAAMAQAQAQRTQPAQPRTSGAPVGRRAW